MKAMIFAAGLGSRFKPWTDQHPKALAIVNGKSLLQRNVEYLQGYGIRDLMVNIHHFGEQVMAAIQQNKGWGSDISLSDERNEVLETGGGLKKAGWFFNDGPFVAINADILTDLNLHLMIRFHQALNPLATLAVTNRISSRYFLFNGEDQLCGWRNTKTEEEKGLFTENGLQEKAFSGIHIISPGIFPMMQQSGKFSIVQTYLDLMTNHPVRGYDHSGGKFIDVGKPEAVAEAERLFL